MRQLLIAVDQLANCIIWVHGDGFGMADETLSARLFRCHLQGMISDIPHRFVDAVFFLDRDHCYQSWRAEFERRHLPGLYRA